MEATLFGGKIIKDLVHLGVLKANELKMKEINEKVRKVYTRRINYC